MSRTLAPDSLGRDLYDYLVDHMYGVPAPKRHRCGWVMNTEWYNECRNLARELGYPPKLTGPDRMFRLPVLPARDDGGVPHLEPID